MHIHQNTVCTHSSATVHQVERKVELTTSCTRLSELTVSQDPLRMFVHTSVLYSTSSTTELY